MSCEKRKVIVCICSPAADVVTISVGKKNFFSVVGVITNNLLYIRMTDRYPQFFTATILEWKPLLKQDKYKRIIVDSLQYLVKNKRVKVFAFVIMPNHTHLIWQMRYPHKREEVQRDFLKYTGQQIRFDLQAYHPAVLAHFQGMPKTESIRYGSVMH